MTLEDKRDFWLSTLIVAVIILAMTLIWALILTMDRAEAKDSGQWSGSNPTIRQWYESLMMPDRPEVSCCREADSYYCDDIHVKDGKTWCVIDDDRDDNKLRRPHVPNGTVVSIPDRKLKWDAGNPVGHAVVFLGGGNPENVYCFVQGSGT